MILLHKKRIQRTIKRMAYQIVEESKGEDICLAGLNKRGYVVAAALKSHIQKQTGSGPVLFRVKAESDEPFTLPESVDYNMVLVLIDDVVFSGITMHRAMEKIQEIDRFKKVIVAALVDRGHRRLPVEAKITGFHVPTKLNEHVEVVVTNDEPEKVLLTSKK